MSDLIPPDAVSTLTEAGRLLRARGQCVQRYQGAEANAADVWFEADVDLRDAIRGAFKGNIESAPHDARLIALMSPGVALAMADMMDAWAKMGRLSPEFLSRVGGLETIKVAQAVLANQ